MRFGDLGEQAASRWRDPAPVRHAAAHSFDNDPDGRIVRDEILYDAASAIAAGMVPVAALVGRRIQPAKGIA